MAGTSFELFPIRQFTAAASAALLETKVIQRVPCHGYMEATILGRLHKKTSMDASATVKIAAYADGYTPEDPSVEFLEPATLTGEVTFTNADSAGAFYATKITGDIGAYLTFVVITDPKTSALDVEISADLVLKS